MKGLAEDGPNGTAPRTPARSLTLFLFKPDIWTWLWPGDGKCDVEMFGIVEGCCGDAGVVSSSDLVHAKSVCPKSLGLS